MSLYGKTDTAADAPTWLSEDPAASRNSLKDNAFFVDTLEAKVPGNRAKGIKTPGWVLYKEYGTGRKYSEVLVPMKMTPGDAGDAGVTGLTATEDLTLVDATVAAAFTIGQWSIADATTGGDAIVTITALPADGGSVITGLQYSIAGGAWTSFSAATTGAYTISGFTDALATNVNIRSVNAVGNSATSDTKSVTTS